MDDRTFERKVVDRALDKGIRVSESYVEVEIPSRTLRTYDRDYGPKLRRMEERRDVKKVLNFGADIGRCNRFWVRVT